jgi:excisionase family DNA binding protein
MGRYITASEAARRIGCTDKTVRKWIAQGKLDAHHVTPNQLAILETDVARIIRERRLYQDDDNQDTLLSRVQSLEQKVVEQEQRLASLERDLHRIAQEAKNRPVPSSTRQSTRTPAKGPENANMEARKSVSDELPDGTLTAVELADKLGISYTRFESMMRHGVRGDSLDITKIPHRTRAGYFQNYFTPAQQEQALIILRRHGKLKETL